MTVNRFFSAPLHTNSGLVRYNTCRVHRTTRSIQSNTNILTNETSTATYSSIPLANDAILPLGLLLYAGLREGSEFL
jgi:hypothetical protein